MINFQNLLNRIKVIIFANLTQNSLYNVNIFLPFWNRSFFIFGHLSGSFFITRRSFSQLNSLIGRKNHL